MIPMMIMFGLAFGWWWRPALVAGALLWPLFLWWAGIYRDLEYVAGGAVGLTLGAAALGAANTGVGIALNRGLQALVRRTGRPRGAAAEPAAPPELE